MNFILLICGGGPQAVAPDGEAPDIETWLAETGTRRLLGEQLVAPSDAVTVRRRNGETMLTDGPYAETKEWIAGFDVISCDSMAEAIEIAARHPVAHWGMVEVRPFYTEDQ
jgi:hypothetical protein